MSEFGYDPVPQEAADFLLAPETVLAKVEVSEMRPSKKNPNNEFLYVESILLEGNQAGRKAITRFNLKNDNFTAVEIARRDFEALSFAIGFEPGNPPKQASDLIGGEYVLDIRVKKRKDDGADENTFRYKRKGSVPAAFTPQQQSAAPAAQAATSGGAPWKRAANG